MKKVVANLCNHPYKKKKSSPDEGQGQDVVRVDGNEPITVLGVRVRMWVVRRQDKAAGTSQISSTRCYNRSKGKPLSGGCFKNAINCEPTHTRMTKHRAVKWITCDDSVFFSTYYS